MGWRWQCCAVIVLLLAQSCRSSEPRPSGAVAAAEPVTTPAPSAGARGATPSVEADLLARLRTCELAHHGSVLDFGDPALESRRHYQLGPFDDTRYLDRKGVRFLQLLHRNYQFELWLAQELKKPTISVRIFPVVSHKITLSVDGKRVSTLRLKPGAATVVTFPVLKTALGAGRHTLSLSVSGRKQVPEKPFAEIAWLRVSEPDPGSDKYTAPTMREIVADVALSNQPRRTVALWQDSTVSCPVRVGSGTRLQADVGFWGNGSGKATIRVLRDGEPAAVLFEGQVAGGESATWQNLDLDLARFSGQLVTLEFGSQKVKEGGRIAFGEPKLVRRRSRVPERPSAKLAILVVMSGLSQRKLPPWGAVNGLTNVAQLVQRGDSFSGYRAPTTVPAGAVASMLTGLSPRAHRVEDQAARLPDTLQTVSQIVKHAGGRTAMFTGVPATFSAFGFDVGFDVYEAISPVVDEPAVAPLTRAIGWLSTELEDGADTRRFIVVHMRGAHPPWDIPKNAAAKLKPEDYDNLIDARRGGISLAEIRNRRYRSQRRLRPEDWTRLGELETHALQRQDALFAPLFRVLRKHELFDRSLLVLVGDVGSGDPPEPPYHPAGPLTEDRLVVPLIAKFAGPGRGRQVNAHATAMDIATTILSELDLVVPDDFEGISLFELSRFGDPLDGRVQLATLGPEYSAFVRPFRLVGHLGQVPSLCRVDVDPACAFDVFDKYPLAGRALWQWTYEAAVKQSSTGVPAREPARIDPETAAALTVWGDIR